MLFEVLTGKRPFQLPTNAPLEAARIVCTEEPAKSGLPVDLDAIIRKCLRKEPASRYASVSGLREDLERALRGEAVTAYQGAWTYHAAKWIRRYKWGVAAAALIVLAIGGGVFTTLRQAQIAQRRSEEVWRLAGTVIFDVYDQVEMLPAATKARATIANTALKYLDGMNADGQRDPGLAMELAEAYLKVGDVLGYPRMANLGRLEEAVASYRKAQILYEGVSVRNPKRSGVNRGRAQVLVRLAALANARLDLPEALRLAAEAERLELAETSDNARRNWALLIHADHERVVADRWLQDGSALTRDAAALGQHAREWEVLQPGSNIRYWQFVHGQYAGLGAVFAGEPSRAYALAASGLREMRKELETGTAHVWLVRGVQHSVSMMSQLQSGIMYASVGDPAAAIRNFDLWAPIVLRHQVHDQNDIRARADDLMTRAGMVPARSQLNPPAGLREFTSIRQSMEDLEKQGNAGAFDDTDYLALSVGGTRALRRLGHTEAALEEVRRDWLECRVRRTLSQGLHISKTSFGLSRRSSRSIFPMPSKKPGSTATSGRTRCCSREMWSRSCRSAGPAMRPRPYWRTCRPANTAGGWNANSRKMNSWTEHDRIEMAFSEGMVEGSGIRSRKKRTTQMKTKSNVKAGGIQINHNQAGLKVASKVRAGGISLNHNQAGLKVASNVKAGGFKVNHNQAGLKVATKVRAGGFQVNHNQTGLKVASKVRAGGIQVNHNQAGLKVASKVKAGGVQINPNQAAR